MQDKEGPLLSIVIPTRNRIPYALPTIRRILGIESSDFQLVIQDSSDSRALEEYLLKNVKDSRLSYNYTPPPLHMVDNFNIAAGLARGEFVCFIGDDDAVNPEIVAAAKWAHGAQVDALMHTLAAAYFWPDVTLHPAFKNPAGRLFIRQFSGKLTYPSVEHELHRLARQAGQGYQFLGLPKLYHGLVRRRCLEQVRESLGAYFQGLSPDIFGSIAVAQYVGKVASVDYPLTINGTAGSSGAGASMAGKHRGKLEEAPHLRGRENYVWPDIIPRFYSVETIWAESCVSAFRELKRYDLLQDFNLPLLSALCVVSHVDFASVIVRDMYRAFDATSTNYVAGSLRFLRSLFSKQTLRALLTSQQVRILANSQGVNRIKEIARQRLVIEVAEYADLATTEDATDALVAHFATLQDECLSPFRGF